MSGGDEARTAVLVRRAFALLAIAAAVGLLVVWILSWTLLSHSDRYGRVDIPGSAVLHLPQGEIEVAFRTLTPTTNGGGGALNVPPLSLGVHPANGKGPDPEVDRTSAPRRASTATPTCGSGPCRSSARATTASSATARWAGHQPAADLRRRGLGRRRPPLAGDPRGRLSGGGDRHHLVVRRSRAESKAP